MTEFEEVDGLLLPVLQAGTPVYIRDMHGRFLGAFGTALTGIIRDMTLKADTDTYYYGIELDADTSGERMSLPRDRLMPVTDLTQLKNVEKFLAE